MDSDVKDQIEHMRRREDILSTEVHPHKQRFWMWSRACNGVYDCWLQSMSLGRSEKEERKWVCRIKMEEVMGEMKTGKKLYMYVCS